MAFQVTQQPRDVRDYDIDFGEWFPADDRIVQAQVFCTPAGLQVNYAIAHPRIKLWVEGGLSGQSYKLELVAYTNDGRAKEVELKIRIKDL